jgi:3-oxoacyl-[acyl-carrier protein] reductase
MDLGLKGKNAAITGSSEGIGYAIARSLAQEGCNVVLAARNEGRLNEAVSGLEALGVKVIGVPVDLSSEDGCREFIDTAVEALGGLDILVNNVGGMIPGTLASLTPEQWATVIDVNLMSCIHCGKQLMPGSLTTTIPNSALIGFSKLMAAELAGAGITVNNICPGITATESWGARAEAMAKVRGQTADDVRAAFSGQTLLGRWAEPEEIGDVAAFLVSEKNGYMTGTTVEVCGGMQRYI